MNENKTNAKSIPGLVLKNVIPSILAMIMVIVYNIADLFFIGQTGDPYQVAAVSLATPIFMIYMAISTIFGVGGTSVISRALGRHDETFAKKVSSFCFWGTVITGVLLSVSVFIFSDSLMIILGASSNTGDMVNGYLRILALSTSFILISSAFSNILKVDGKPMIAATGMMIGNLINIILDPIFISYLDMGVNGAAFATLIGNIFAAIFYVYILLKKTKVLSIKISDFKIKEKVFSSVMAIGIPASLASIFMSISNIIVNGSIAAYGDLAVAGIGVAMKVMMIATFVCIGFGQGIQPLLGFAMGGNNHKQFSDIMKFSFISSILLSAVITTISYLGLNQIVGMFLNEPEAYDYAMSFSKIMLSTSYMFGVFFVLVNAVQAIGAAKASLIINISRQGIIYIPMIFILNYFVGLNGIVMAQPVTDIISMAILVVLYVREVKKVFNNADSKEIIVIEAV